MADAQRSGLPILDQISRLSAGAILGLAWVVGLSTERLGSIGGPQAGGILNATFGNIAELIIGFFALQAGLIGVVKA